MRAALMIREAQRPKRIRLYRWQDLWFVRNEFLPRTTYCGSFEDARETLREDVALVEVKMLQRMWVMSHAEEV